MLPFLVVANKQESSRVARLSRPKTRPVDGRKYVLENKSIGLATMTKGETFSKTRLFADKTGNVRSTRAQIHGRCMIWKRLVAQHR